MKIGDYFFDEHLTRYQLVKSNRGKLNYNWLFLPGGPGIDSSYLQELIYNLDIEGNCWFIDFVLNGNNCLKDNNKNTSSLCQNWGYYFLQAISNFENPILVGHSFGGYFPLFFPELESVLKGLVILSAAPTAPLPPANLEPFEQCAKENKLPERVESFSQFLNNPTKKAATNCYLSTVPYAFTKEYLKQGIALIEQLAMSVEVSHWWLTEGAKQYTTIRWIPKEVPSLILGGTHDFVTPFSGFENDKRFHRKNIKLVSLPDAGHFPWVEQPHLISEVFNSSRVSHFPKNALKYAA
jgi:pimeloyl-ACP methyl ester carboxylesterase